LKASTGRRIVSAWGIAWFVFLLVLMLGPALGRALARPVGVPVEVARLAFPALSPIYFGAGATDLGRKHREALDAHAASLRGDDGRMLLIEGHTDGPADHLLSIEIGERRARAVMAYLISKGVAAAHIALASHGGGRPACTEKTAACRASNRRVTFSTRKD
jgi:peptidoglycan-associated lipoprotein